MHPRILTEGFDLARAKALEVLDSIKIPIEVKRADLLDVARTSLKTKVCVDIFISVAIELDFYVVFLVISPYILRPALLVFLIDYMFSL